MISRTLSRTLSYRQRYVLALTRTVSGSLSLCASLIILNKIFQRYRQKRGQGGSIRSGRPRSGKESGNNTYYRMLFSVSVLDVLHSIWCALSVLPAPPSSHGVFAYGTTATCSTQAFFVQLTTPIVLYMAALNMYFMLKIRYNVSDARIERYYEPWFHLIPLLFWFITGTVGLSLKIFNAIALPELGCWIAPYPVGCTRTDTCTRGYRIADLIDWYAWSFAYIWLFLCVLVVLVNGCLIYTAIRKQEQRNAIYLASSLQMEGSANISSLSSSHSASKLLCSMPEFNFLEEEEDASNEVAVKPAVSEAPSDGDFVVSLEETSNVIVPETTSVTLPKTAKDTSSSAAERGTMDDPAIPKRPKKGSSSARRREAGRVNARRIRQSRTAAVQSSLYLCSALFTAVWIFLPWMGSKLQVEARTRFFFAFMVNIVSPSQGVFNLFIFVRLQYLHLRETKKGWSRMRCVYQTLYKE
jgi:hypothetical protein